MFGKRKRNNLYYCNESFEGVAHLFCHREKAILTANENRYTIFTVMEGDLKWIEK